MAIFHKYETSENEDGTFDIQGVEIFALGVHRGFDYNLEWFKKVCKTQMDNEANGYYPPVIIGHNSDEDGEKPACGFFKNLTLDGDIVKADLTHVPKSVHEIIMDRRYPYRSIEVENDRFEITAVALLGGSEPYFKLPILEIFKKAEGNRKEEIGNSDQVVNFQKHMKDHKHLDTLRFAVTQELTIEEEVIQEEKTSRLRKYWDVISRRIGNLLWGDGGDGMTPEEVRQGIIDTMSEGLDDLKDDKQTEPSAGGGDEQYNKEKGADMAMTLEEKNAAYEEKFKAEFGCSPEEYRNKQKAADDAAETARVQAFTAKLETLKVSGAAKEKIDAFSKGQKTAEDVRQLILEIVEFSDAGTLTVDTGEHARRGRQELPETDDGHPDGELAARVEKYQKEKKCGFTEAYKAVTDEMNEEAKK